MGSAIVQLRRPMTECFPFWDACADLGQVHAEIERCSKSALHASEVFFPEAGPRVSTPTNDKFR
jgi:hypothetical protein